MLAVGLILLCPAFAAVQPSQETVRKLERANALVQAGKPEAAIPLYRELVAAFPAEPSLGVNLAIALFKANLFPETVTECRRLLRQRPALFPALLFLGASHLKLGQASNAVQPLRQALEINPGDANARLMLADALFSLRQFAESAERYSQVAAALPDNPRVWHGLYRCNSELAEETISRLQTLAPASAEFAAISGDLERRRLQFARAFQFYRQALAARPTFRGLHGKVAEIYELTGHPEWAAAERAREIPAACAGMSVECDFSAGRLQEAASADTATPGSLYWRTIALLELAQRAYDRLFELPPSRERFEAAAEAHEAAGRYREAAAAWKDALTQAPGDHELQRRQALALCHSNDCVAALPLLQGLLAATPTSAELNYLCGLAMTSTRDPAKALPLLETAVRLDSRFLPARGALGEALLEAGQAERAIPHLEAAAASDDSGVRRYQFARALQAAGRREQASQQFKLYREMLDRRTAAEKDEPRITAP